MLLSRVGKKVEIDRSSDENLEIDTVLLFSEHLCSRNKRKTYSRRPELFRPSTVSFSFISSTKDKPAEQDRRSLDRLPFLCFLFRTDDRFRSRARGPIARSKRLFDRVRMDCGTKNGVIRFGFL